MLATIVQLFTQAIDIFMHLDVHLTSWSITLGPWLYVLLFVIVFSETGLVVTPFLPGDSLLFAAGALAALPGSSVQIGWLMLVLFCAGALGDTVNYSVGKRVGPRVFNRPNSRLLNQKHLARTHEFYEKHGGQTIIIAQYMPIIRTFAPFVAGIGLMRYRRFLAFNVIGVGTWVALFTQAGYWFGNIPGVRRNFQFVVIAIIAISLMPITLELIRSWRSRTPAGQE